MPRTLFYLDTNCLIYARHFDLCKDLDEAYFPQNVRTGQIFTETLDLCERREEQLELRTSAVADFEINNLLRMWITKSVFIEHGVPVETLEGRSQDYLANFHERPQAFKEEYEEKLKEYQEWYRALAHRRLTVIDSVSLRSLDLAGTLPTIAPGI